MKTIYKYPLNTHGFTTLAIHHSAKVLSVASQNNSLVMWAEVDTSNNLITREFFSALTGGALPDIPDGYCRNFTGTAVMFNGQFVVHVFEIVEDF